MPHLTAGHIGLLAIIFAACAIVLALLTIACWAGDRLAQRNPGRRVRPKDPEDTETRFNILIYGTMYPERAVTTGAFRQLGAGGYQVKGSKDGFLA